jgi:hypothetical protein
MVVAPLIRRLDKIHGLTAEERQALEKLPATLRDFSPGEILFAKAISPRWCAWWLMERLSDTPW